MKKATLSFLIIFAISTAAFHANAETCDGTICHTDWQLINRVLLRALSDGNLVVFAEVMDEGIYKWYKYTDPDPQKVAAFESLLLTAYSTKREVMIYYDTDSTIITNVYMR